MKEVSLLKLLADKENLERILDNLTEGIIAHDKERRILFFNRAAEIITGFKRDEVLGKDCHDAFGRPFCGDRCAFLGTAPEVFPDKTYPLTFLNRKQLPKRIEMNVTSMTDYGGRFVGIIAAFRDVTDLIGLRLKAGEIDRFAGIVGRDPKMLNVYRQIQDLAATDFPVHISGETGTGKELVALAIHNESQRAGRPFVPINCGALPEGILESELFGHVKGAFTGAIRDKKGRFELADGGTIFLDEVAELPRTVQVKLLRVVQESRFEKVGDEKTISVNVRLISATNRDLRQEVASGRFREDLYYRICVVPIHLPPLRERKADIPLLAEHFLAQAAEKNSRHLLLSRTSTEALNAYDWPGNIRELQSAVHYAIVRSRGSIIQPDDLPPQIFKNSMSKTEPGPRRKLNHDLVKAALEKSGGNRAKAARNLGVGRATLYRFLGQKLKE
ncbi:MAG: PAS domain-containing protein [Desulfobacteraceae bacterium]|jgi:transcriptional regulator with PAS, ATPase and Fis domain|nr:MAG: PAS domain-containing protein [Desulfobacteraceae bacterium]